MLLPDGYKNSCCCVLVCCRRDCAGCLYRLRLLWSLLLLLCIRSFLPSAIEPRCILMHTLHRTGYVAQQRQQQSVGHLMMTSPTNLRPSSQDHLIIPHDNNLPAQTAGMAVTTGRYKLSAVVAWRQRQPRTGLLVMHVRIHSSKRGYQISSGRKKKSILTALPCNYRCRGPSPSAAIEQ